MVNIGSLRAKDKVELVQNYMHSTGIPLVFVTESWINETEEHQVWLNCCALNRDGFTLINRGRAERRGGGIAAIHDDSVKVTVKDDGFKETFQYVSFVVGTTSVTFNILVIYRPPDSNIRLFEEEFIELLTGVTMDQSNTIICGDFNVQINNSDDPYIQQYLDMMSAAGYKQQVQFFTHRRGNILDHVYTDALFSRLNAVTPGPFLSDHRAVEIEFAIKKSGYPTKTISSRDLRNVDSGKFKAELVGELESLPELSDNLEEYVAEFERRLRVVLDAHAPVKEKTVVSQPKNLWFTAEIAAQRRVVRKRERLWMRCKTDELWEAFKAEKNKLSYMIRSEKTMKISSKVAESKGDSKKLYGLLRDLTGVKTANPLPEGSSEVLAENFAEYFMTKIDNIRKKLDHMPLYDPSDSNCPKVYEWLPLSEDELGRIIGSMASKSCESDALPTEVLKEHLDVLLKPLLNIINTSLLQGYFPQCWKEAIIRPLLKKVGLSLISSNYRPVSNLKFIAKVCEKAMMLRLDEHCTRHGLHADHQSAYKRGHSCETALVKIVNDLLWAFEHQEVTAFVAIDLSAAFDTVDHDVLLKVLQRRFGLEGAALRWADTYLRPRQFVVNVGKSYSLPRQLQYCVPQGSCAGPTYFNMYSSTIKDVIPENISIGGFADDHALTVKWPGKKQEDQQDAIAKLEYTLSEVEVWMQENRLKMNSDKTEYALFCPPRLTRYVTCKTINVNGETIESSNVIKYLGAWLDEHLTMRKHIAQKCKTAMLNILRLKSIRPYLDMESSKILASGIVLSHLDYGNTLYSGLPKKDIYKLQRTQSMCAKVVTKRSKYDSATEALKTLNWLPVDLRVTFKVLSLVHQCVYGGAPSYLMDLIATRPQRRSGLRSNDDNTLLTVPFTKRKTYGDRSFSVIGPKWWNDLPCDLRSTADLNLFKKKLKTHLFQLF